MVVRCLYNVVLVAACVTVNTCAGHSHNSTNVDDPVSCYSSCCGLHEEGNGRQEDRRGRCVHSIKIHLNSHPLGVVSERHSMPSLESGVVFCQVTDATRQMPTRAAVLIAFPTALSRFLAPG